MSWRNVRVACGFGLLSLVAASACGGSSSDPGKGASGGADQTGGTAHGGSTGRAGSGGSGGKTATAGAPATLECGTATCSAVVIPVGDFTIPPCCADAATNQCGLDSSVLSAFGPTFTEACQPLNQPGVVDGECPASASTPVMGSTLQIQFNGCCRDNGTCGYLLDKLGGLFPLGLGCVDSAPFLDGGTPPLCGGGGVGGASQGAGGEAGASQGGVAGALESVAGEGGLSGASGGSGASGVTDG